MYDDFYKLINFVLKFHFEQKQMRNFSEDHQFSDQIAKNISQTKQKNSSESFQEKFSEIQDFRKKIGNDCGVKQIYDRFASEQGLGQDNILKIEWTEAEENTLIEKHREIGNKWASISQFLNRKNDNCVKNHFYSKLRKMIRKLNRIIQLYFKKSLKSIPNTTIYKLVEASEQRFKQKPMCSYQVSMGSQDVISKMLKMSASEDNNLEQNNAVDKGNLDDYKQLIQQINRANKNYKKKSKKIKNSSIKAPIRTKKGSRTKKQLILLNDLNDDYSADQSQIESQQQYQMIAKSYNSKPKFYKDIRAEDQEKQMSPQKAPENKIQVKEGDQMQELLNNIGLIHEGKKARKYMDQKSEFGSQSIKSFQDFQNPSEALSFFEDSNNCWRKESKMFTRINRRIFGGSGSEIDGI